jgi:hypothetical protein
MNYNQSNRIYEYLSENHFLKPLYLKQYSVLPEAVRNDLSKLTAHCSNLEERILKLYKIIKDVKRIRETKKRSEV